MRLIGLAVILTVGLTLGSLAAEAEPAGKVARIGYLLLPPLAEKPSAERHPSLHLRLDL
jgi:hypothetical protein